MTIDETYVSIVQTALSHLTPGDDSVLACMVAIHTNDIVLDSSCFPSDMISVDEPRKLYAVTRRHAARIVAIATGNANNQDIIDSWYATYCSATPYEVMEDIPQPRLSQVFEAIAAMRKTPGVQDIIEAE